jgi:histidinol dehydrogenase
MASSERRSVLRVSEWHVLDEAERQRFCARGLAEIFDPALRTSIADLVDDVRQNGDEAVCRALAKFDGVSLRPDQLAISAEAIASASVPTELEAALAHAITNLRTFNDVVMEQAADWTAQIEPGLSAGERVSPISSAGLFVPSGKASYPSVAYQLGVPAVVAGVPDIALLVPPQPGAGGEVDPAVLVVCRMLGITRVYRANGPAGIAALGFGTESISPVRKIVGPGSPAVTCAQVEMQRHGVATMMLLGPTESLVIADDSADPVRLAADLLIEAEHGTDSSVVLVTTSTALVTRVDAELERQLAVLPDVRATAARASLGPNGGAVIVRSLEEAAAVANRYAPEHLQVAVADRDTDRLVDMLVNAGEILIGQDTPFSAGNFLIGCPASLPTSGFAHVSSGITAAAFLKRTAWAKANEAALRHMAPSIVTLAQHEGFPAHANAITNRFEEKGTT